MNGMPAKLQARADRKLAKRDEKKRKIAESAIEALKLLGYANTSLRDIAAQSDLSLGMLHYYFEDRSDLIIYCVEIYKEEFVRKINQALEKADGREDVITAFTDALVGSIIDDGMTHRLWYDIRSQAMFDVTFRPVVADIESQLIQTVKTALIKAGHQPSEQVAIQYALLDGVFRHFMQQQLSDDPMTESDLRIGFRSVLEQFL